MCLSCTAQNADAFDHLDHAALWFRGKVADQQSAREVEQHADGTNALGRYTPPPVLTDKANATTWATKPDGLMPK